MRHHPVLSTAALRATLIAAMAVGVATCKGSTEPSTSTPPPPARKATYLKFTAYPGDVNGPGPQAPPAVAGVPVNLEVSVMAQDSAVIAVSDPITVTLQGGRLQAGTTTITSVSGVAKFTDLVIDSAAFTYQFIASTADLPSRTGSSFTVAPGPLGAVKFVGQPTEVWAGTTRWPDNMQEPSWFTVEALDQYANVRWQGGDTVTLSITPGTGTAGAKLGGAFSGVTPNTGVRTLAFPLVTVDKVGSGYTLTATSKSVASTPSAQFKVSPVLAFLVQPGPVAPATVFTPAVQVGVVDGNLQPVANVATSVKLTMPGGNGTLLGTLTRNASSGIATFSNLSINKYLGIYQLRATATGTVTILNAASDSFPARGVALHLVGQTHPCALADDGHAYCFFSQFQPTLEGITAASMVAGDGFYCGLTSDGQASCASGNGSAAALAGGLTFTQLTAGRSHACGLTSAGAAYCWGSDSNGQLGDSLANAQCSGTACWTPVAVKGGLTFSQLSAGQYHTCGLTTGGQAYCWGANNFGQLGNFQVMDRPAPVAVFGGLVFTSLLATSGSTACGLTSGGQAYCWGVDNFGQVGNGATQDSVLYPVAVNGGLTFVQLVGGLGHTCGLTAGGQAYCWGLNESGQLGDGTSADRTSPVAVVGGRTFVEISAGWYNTCGRTSSGQVYCWGDNTGGELGDGTIVNRTTPVRVVIF